MIEERKRNEDGKKKRFKVPKGSYEVFSQRKTCNIMVKKKQKRRRGKNSLKTPGE